LATMGYWLATTGPTIRDKNTSWNYTLESKGDRVRACGNEKEKLVAKHTKKVMKKQSGSRFNIVKLWSKSTASVEQFLRLSQLRGTIQEKLGKVKKKTNRTNVDH